MAALLISLLWALAVAVLITRAVGQSRYFAAVPPDIRPAGPLPSVAVIIPARNEADRIGRCLAGLLAQTYPTGRFSVAVVDDASSDATARIVERVAEEAPALRLLQAPPLPPGWLGKPHACWHGAQAADADWLCFIDADTVPEPRMLTAAVATARQGGLDMLSLEPRQELRSFWERLVLPTGFLLLAFFKDLRTFDDRSSAAATANGQFILVRRSVYEAVGGHDAVRAEIAEDKRLAERVKRAGYRVTILDGGRLIRVRMYAALRPLWEGLSKHAAEIAGGAGLLLLYAVAGIVLGIAEAGLPAWCWTRLAAGPITAGSVLAAVLSTAGTLALAGVHLGTLRHFRVPLRYALLAPASFLTILLIAASCVMQRATGRTRWKGRVYALGRRPDRLRNGASGTGTRGNA